MNVKTASRVLALLAVLAGVILVWIYRSEIHPAAIRDAVANNPFAPLIFLALQIAASLLFVPRTVLGLTAGLVFGMFWGSVWALLGAIAGAAAGFAFVRWLGAEGVLDASPGIGKLVEKAERGGWRAVAILRLLPVPHSIANTALALTEMGWTEYLVGSALGMVPMTLAQVAIGASGGEALAKNGSWAIACVLLAAGLGLSFFLRRATPSEN